MHTATFCGSQLNIYITIKQGYALVARLNVLLIVREATRYTLWHFLAIGPFCMSERKEHYIFEVGAPNARLMGVAEAIDLTVMIDVTRPGEECVGTQLHHTKRRSCNGSHIAVIGGSHHRSHQIHRLCLGRHQRSRKNTQQQE